MVLLKGVCKILFTNAMFKSMNIFEAFFCNICLLMGKCCKIVLDILCHFLLPITLPGVARQLVSVSHSNQHFFFYILQQIPYNSILTRIYGYISEILFPMLTARGLPCQFAIVVYAIGNHFFFFFVLSFCNFSIILL